MAHGIRISGDLIIAVHEQVRQAALATLVSAMISFHALPAFGQSQPTPPKAPTAQDATETSSIMRIWIGASHLAMEDFNAKLRSEQNHPIGTAFTVAGEVDAVLMPVFKTISIRMPIGVEFITAGSKTDHATNGASATVNWSLPTLGIYVSPRLSFQRQRLQINLRPLGFGYYWLGQVVGAAELAVSDRPGTLGATSGAVGYIGTGGLEYRARTGTMLFEAGYRHLLFTDVSLTPKNGFTTGPVGGTVQAGNLPQTLDFSGWILRVGMGVHM